MTDNEIKEIIFTRADMEAAERICCDNCFEQLVFMLKDKEHEFSVGLTTILECLEFAILDGDLPKLSSDWIEAVQSRYDILFDENILL